MHINPNFFIIARPPFTIVWNYKEHTQYELDASYSTRLIQLVEDPALFDGADEIDGTFLAAGLLSAEPFAEPEWGWDELSRIFHVGTKNLPFEQLPKDIHEWSALYLEHCQQVLDTQPPTERFDQASPAELIELPAPLLENTGNALAQVLLKRKTSRSFHARPMALEDLGNLLYLSLGYLRERQADPDESAPETLRARRASPSGGGLNACEGYVYAARVEGLTPGIYFYHSQLHALQWVHSLPNHPLGLLLAGQHFINDLPMGLFITARFDKLWWKYEHSRAYRMAYVEAGHISQTFQLAATDLGLGTWLTGAFNDEQVEQLLGLDNSAEQPLFFVGSGYSDGQAQCKELRALIADQEQEQ